MEKLYFAKVVDDARIPSKHKEDAGYDVYAYITSCVEFEPHETVIVQTGIKSAFPEGYAGLLKERGSTGVKGIGQRAGVIDSGYRGQWLVAVTNHSNKPMVITNFPDTYSDKWIVHPANKAIAQVIFVKLGDFEVKEIDGYQLAQMTSKRADGKLGSSGK